MTRLLRIFAATSSIAFMVLLIAPLAQAASVTPVVQAGSAHSIALKYDGTVWTWGSNAYGQLGNGSAKDSTTPVQVKNLNNVVAIAAGLYHNVAVKSDGTVWAWGANFTGQLGNNTLVNSNVPVQMLVSAAPNVGLANGIAVAAGWYHSMVLTTGGLYTVGDNTYGEIGDGTNTRRLMAVPIALPGVTAIAGGEGYSVALTNTGQVWAWGADFLGELGDGAFINQNAPVLNATLANIVQISAKASTTLALDNKGVVWGWGVNDGGQVGNGGVASPVTPPGQSNVSNFVVTSIAAGGFHSLAITNDAEIIGWGTNSTGQLSNIPPQTFTAATGLSSVGGVVQLAAGISHSLGYKPDGTVIAFGNNATGQLGDGTEINRLIPVTVVGEGGLGFLNLLGLADLSVTVSGSGVVTSSPSGINCASGTCVAAFPAGTVVTLTAKPTPANGLQGWGGACSGTGSCIVTVNAEESVNAAFTGNSGPVSGTIPATGYWWNPAEPGRGYVIDVENGQIFFASFLYSFSGEATWYASGPTAFGGGSYAGVLNLYGSGQTLTGPFQQATQVGGTFGGVTINFISPTAASMTWPEGTINIERYDFVPNGSKLAVPPGTPQAGYWWNPNEPGRGFSIEVQGGTLLIAGYMYDANGNPTWYSSQGAMNGTTTYQGNWVQYGYGQTLTGGFQSASVFNANVGALTIQFSSPTAGTMTLPDGRQIPITRFLVF